MKILQGRFKKKNKLRGNIFKMFTLSIVITIFMISAILYFNFERITRNIVYSDALSSLEQTSRDANIMAETGVTLINQIYRDLTISKLLYYNEPDVYEVQPAMTQLRSYSQVMQFISSINVYNGQINRIYIASNAINYENNIQSQETFQDKELLSILRNHQNYKPFTPIPRQIVLQTPEKEEVNCYTFLGYSFLDSGSSLRSAVVVNISEDWFNNIIHSNSNGAKVSGDTFIMDAAGKVISNSEPFPMMTVLSELPYARKILSDSNNGYIIDQVKGVKSLISFTAPDALGWRYIRVIPYYQITKDIEAMKVNTILIAFALLVIGFLFSMVASKILYKPIEKISLDLDSLETEKRNNLYTLKQDYLRRIILDITGSRTNDHTQKFNEYRICLPTEGVFYAALFKVDRYADFVNNNTPEDRTLLKYAIMNVAAEIFSQKFNVEAVDMGDDSMVLLLNSLNSSETPAEEDFRSLYNSTQAAVSEHLDLSVSATISRAADSITSIQRIYRMTAEISLHRLFYGHGSILFVEKFLSYASKEYVYPAEKEKAIQEELLKGRVEEAKKLYLDIINESAEYPFSVINIVISRLVFAVNSTLNTLQKNHQVTSISSKRLLFVHLHNIETVDEIHNRLFEAIDEVSKIIQEKKSSKQEVLINKVNEIINKEYPNPGLCVDSIASSLDMSATYMGRVYKQYTMESILDRILKVRMEKARSLLLETDLPIAKVAEMTGFSDDSYFYKTFKKENGITPSDYRKNSSKQ